jgi:hypothetical protein
MVSARLVNTNIIHGGLSDQPHENQLWHGTNPPPKRQELHHGTIGSHQCNTIRSSIRYGIILIYGRNHTIECWTFDTIQVNRTFSVEAVTISIITIAIVTYAMVPQSSATGLPISTKVVPRITLLPILKPAYMS